MCLTCPTATAYETLNSLYRKFAPPERMMKAKLSGMCKCFLLSIHIPIKSWALSKLSRGLLRLWYSNRSPIGVCRYSGKISSVFDILTNLCIWGCQLTGKSTRFNSNSLPAAIIYLSITQFNELINLIIYWLYMVWSHFEWHIKLGGMCSCSSS